MSKRSKHKQVGSTTRTNQQVALAGGLNIANVRPSIATLVLQRMDKFSDLLPDVNGAKPAVKVTPVQNKALPAVDTWPKNWPVCPKTCDLMEWRKSLENKEYYELKQIEDDGKKAWFQYPRFTYQYSEFVYCTPEMMKSLLANMPINRNCKWSWVEAIARDVSNERWIQSHESIAVNKQGNMHDGQHRAQGIIKADRGWPIYITWNVPPEAIYITDSGDKRKINEKLALLFPESKIGLKQAALCRSMMWGLTNRGIRYSESEIAEFAVKHHDVLMWVSKNMNGYRSDLQAVIGKGLLWWGEELLTPFVKRLKSVQFQGEGDPAKALYLWIQKSKQEGKRAAYTNPLMYYRKCLAAVYAHAGSKEASRLSQNQSDVFDWLPGWEVPVERPCKGKVFLPLVEEVTPS